MLFQRYLHSMSTAYLQCVYTQPYVYSSTVSNGQHISSTKVSISRTDKENVVCTHHGILFSYKQARHKKTNTACSALYVKAKTLKKKEKEGGERGISLYS